MKYEKLLTKIKKHVWWQERAPAVYAFTMYPLHSFIEQCRYFHIKYLTAGIFITVNDIFYEFSPEDEKLKIYNYVFKRSKKDRNFLVKKKSHGDKSKIFLKTGEKFIKERSRMANRQIWQSYSRFMQAEYIEYLRHAVAAECVDIFTAYHLEELVRGELKGQTKQAVQDLTRTMAMPAHLSFMEHERVLFLRICLGLYKKINRKKNLTLGDLAGTTWRRRLEDLSKQYHWIRNTFAHVKYLTPEYYFYEVKSAVREKSFSALKKELVSLNTKVRRLKKLHRDLLKQHKISSDLKLHFYLVRLFGEWIDDRKCYMLQANYMLNEYCREIADRFNLDIWEAKYYLPEDFKRLLLQGKKLDSKVARARREFSAYVVLKKGRHAQPFEFYGLRAKKLLNEIMKQYSYSKDEVKGQVSCAPVDKISGRVEVILDTHKQKFTSGNILVTTMTRPEFVPYMRRAKAVVTEEGGLTCHAAIVSRELGIPCIIGTKVATSVFKTGDQVTMDLTSGIIKKYKIISTKS